MKLFQILLSDAVIDKVNAGAPMAQVPEYKAHLDALCYGKFPGSQFYTHVADIDTTDLNHAFEIGNIGPEEKILRYAPMHSVSVGDVLVTDYGVAFIVKSVGFEALDWQEAA